MTTVDVNWTGSKLRFRLDTERLPGVQVDVDEPEPIGENTGVMPTELFLGSLGACVGMNAVALLRKRRQPLKGLTVNVSGTQQTQWPKAFTDIEVGFRVGWDGEPDWAVVDEALEKAVRSYCPIGATLAAGLQVQHRREALPEGDSV